MSERSTVAIVRGFLDTQSTLALATIAADGQAQVAPVFYVNDDRLNLYWLSDSRARHSVNLLTKPKVSATIYPSVWQWNDIVGLQIEGDARAVADERMREQVLVLYLRKFQLPPTFDSAIATSALYSLRPTWMRWMDNSVRFGYREELRF